MYEIDFMYGGPDYICHCHWQVGGYVIPKSVYVILAMLVA